MVEEADSTVRVCETGLPASEARQTVALVGDSHAEQWIPTLDMLAKSRGWHILRILKSKCSFNAAAPDLSPRARDSCATWNRDVAKELARRPEISELFVSSSSFNAYVAEPGQKWQEIAARGYRTSWAALPGHIARIHVLRDVPRPRPDVIQCLERLGSDEARLAPGACARPAKEALLWDPLVSAAADEPRADVIDLSSRFCNANSCWPVIGHVLVYRDKSHLGATFARSLAPFLERELDRLALPGAAKGR
jgi:hypothetical protein